MSEITEEKRIHQVWKELEDAKEKDPHLHITPIIGKYQYVYSNGSESISLVELINYLRDEKDLWEIYQIKGDTTLFEDVERFDTKEEGKKKCEEYLSNNKNIQTIVK